LGSAQQPGQAVPPQSQSSGQPQQMAIPQQQQVYHPQQQTQQVNYSNTMGQPHQIIQHPNPPPVSQVITSSVHEYFW